MTTPDDHEPCGTQRSAPCPATPPGHEELAEDAATDVGAGGRTTDAEPQWAGQANVMISILEDLEAERDQLRWEIQERRRAERDLARMAAIVESSHDAIIGVTLGGRITDWNPAAERIFGYPADTAIGQGIDLVAPGGHSESLESMFDRIVRGDRLEQIESVFQTQDGRAVNVSLTMSPVLGTNGGVGGVSLIARDISDRVEAEHALRVTNDQLRQKHEEMEHFLHTVSHDLKSPIVTCKGFLALIRAELGDVVTGQVDEWMSFMEVAVQRMSRNINDLLELSRVGRARNEPEPVDLTLLVRQILCEMSDRFEAKGVEVRVQEDMPPVTADRARMVDVFENLLCNALKYGCGADRPVVEVGVETRDGEVRVFVRDNGPGIPERMLDRVFELFQRASQDEEGSGVGLAIVAKIMEACGGRSWVESVEGEGACFWLSFPADAAAH